MMFGRGPFLHREMAHQDDRPILKKREPRRPMCQPADIFGRLPEQRAFRRDQFSVGEGTQRLDESEDDAFRRFRLEKFVISRIDQISDEEPNPRLRARLGAGKESISFQRSA